MALLLSLNTTQHDSYGVFRLQLRILVGKARFILEKNVRNYSDTAKKLPDMLKYISLIFK